ncbi:O-antigen ligase family protein [Halocatena pleomorpha]|uniref:O-antigen ligase domain-containing protein n=1 Tax=Halocatena pleomorpha TaxID=1785090 RepID=A0A3P3R614_9EURY|nr:O-antigen ligase family protein [Halocatena pleomorpha]RRJ28339.1 O-antigen ligase domain-containing protein [Halocatena pleomorpha]
MSYTVVRNSLLSFLSEPPGTASKRGVLLSALSLTALLVVVVPVVTLTTGFPLLAVVAIAGVVYASGIVLTDNLLEGMCSGIIVLCTFQAEIPIAGISRGGRLGAYTVEIMLADVAAVPLVVLLAMWSSTRFRLPTDRHGRIAVYALAGLVVWSVIAAVVGDGPSTMMGLFFSVAQLRHLLLFGTAMVIGRYVGLRTIAYSLLIAVSGHTLFAIAEVFNRGSFGLSYLGEASGYGFEIFHIGPMAVTASTYAGGFTGISRILITLLFLVMPVAIERVIRGSNWQQMLSLGFITGGVFLLRVNASDSGWAAFLLTVLLLFGSIVYIHLRTNETRSGPYDYARGYATTVGAGLLSCLLFLSRTSSEKAPEPKPTPEPKGDSGMLSQVDSEMVVSVVDAVPLINTGNLSIRVQQYIAALEIGITNPLFGIGGMNFSLVAQNYGVPRAISMHNVYLSFLVGTGIPGVILFVTSLLAVLFVAVKNAMTVDDEDRLLWAMIACGMLGFHAINFWIAAGEIGKVAYMTFWMLAGAVVGSRT